MENPNTCLKFVLPVKLKQRIEEVAAQQSIATSSAIRVALVEYTKKFPVEK